MYYFSRLVSQLLKKTEKSCDKLKNIYFGPYWRMDLNFILIVLNEQEKCFTNEPKQPLVLSWILVCIRNALLHYFIFFNHWKSLVVISVDVLHMTGEDMKFVIVRSSVAMFEPLVETGRVSHSRFPSVTLSASCHGVVVNTVHIVIKIIKQEKCAKQSSPAYS